VTHIWTTRGSEESVIFIKFTKCCYSHSLCGPICPTAPPPPRMCKMMLLVFLRCHFVHRYDRTILKIYSESSFQGDSNDTNFSSLGLSCVNNRHFKPHKIIQEVSACFSRQKAFRKLFLCLQTTIVQLRISLENWN
jgi:hypothetical protein